MYRLAISNIAWTGNDAAVLGLLSRLGVEGVEVAPAKIASWKDLTLVRISRYRALCDEHGLCIPSFQAVFYGMPELQLLGEQIVFDRMVDHIALVADMAQVAGARLVVFGAPKNRLLLGYDKTGAFSLAVERLHVMAEVAWAAGVCICLEAVPLNYGGEFITSYIDSLALVEAVRHPGLEFHFDVGCVFLNGDEVEPAIREAGKRISHFHITQPDLGNFFCPEKYHYCAAKALNELTYNQWLSIEMKETGSPLESIEIAVKAAKAIYGQRE